MGGEGGGWILPPCAVDDLALHEAVDVLKLLLSAGQRLRHRRHVQPEGTTSRFSCSSAPSGSDLRSDSHLVLASSRTLAGSRTGSDLLGMLGVVR